MDTSTTASLRRHTAALSFVVGLHVVFAIALIAATSIQRAATVIILPPPPVYRTEELPVPVDTPPPLPRTISRTVELPLIDLQVVQPPHAVVATDPTTHTVDTSIEKTWPPAITAARLARGVNLAELCQGYYPAASKRLGEEGSVVVLIYVAASGRVTDGRIDTSSGIGRLDEAALKCVLREGRFEPEMNGANATGSWQRMKYTWRLTT